MYTVASLSCSLQKQLVLFQPVESASEKSYQCLAPDMAPTVSIKQQYKSGLEENMKKINR